MLLKNKIHIFIIAYLLGFLISLLFMPLLTTGIALQKNVIKKYQNNICAKNKIFIEDSEGDGATRLNSISLVEGTDTIYAQFDDEGKRVNATTYLVFDTPTEANPDQQRLLISIDGGLGGSITIKGWVADNFGIALGDAPAIAVPEQAVTTSTLNVVFDGGLKIL